MLGGPAIVAWHRIAEDPLDPFALCTSPERFRAQLARLSAERRVVPLEELIAAPAPDAIALTLDDGYRDALELAAPILRAAGLPATFFVTTAPLASGAPFFWDELVHAFAGAGDRPATFESWPTATAADREAALRGVHALAYKLTLEARDQLVAHVRRWAGPAPAALPRPLDARGVRALAEQPGCHIGAHGVHHLHLPTQPAEALAHELHAGRAALHALLGQPPATFAYPFGAWSDQVRDAVRAAGYHNAVTVEARRFAAGDDRWALPRFDAGAFLEAA